MNHKIIQGLTAMVSSVALAACFAAPSQAATPVSAQGTSAESGSVATTSVGIPDNAAASNAADGTVPQASATHGSAQGKTMIRGDVPLTSQDDLLAAITAAGSVATTLQVGDMTLSGIVDIPEGANITLAGAGTITVEADAGLRVAAGGTLALDGPTVDGGGSAVSHGRPMIVSSGDFRMESGVVQNYTASSNQSWEWGGGAGGAIGIIGGSFTMDGGSVQHNIGAGFGGGILVANLVYTESVPGLDATVNGGNISDNTVPSEGGLGGGMALVGGVDLTVNGGTISGNTAGLAAGSQACGGGIGAMGWGSSPATVVIHGGTISGNKAIGRANEDPTQTMQIAGGGVYLEGLMGETRLTVDGGNISNNESAGVGGGIWTANPYASSSAATIENYATHIYNAVISGNTASNLGGGLWTTVGANTQSYATNGAAIFDNIATNAMYRTAGDDVVAHPAQGLRMSLSERLLGGGHNHWYRDGGIQANLPPASPGSYPVPNVAPDPNVPRYAQGDVEIGSSVDTTDPIALKNVTDAGQARLAKSMAKVTISGNKARTGAGVASSGMLVLGGTLGGNTGDGGAATSDATVSAHKVWDEVPQNKRQTVTVSLHVKGTLNGGDTVDQEVGTASLSDANDWQVDFTGLPALESLKENGNDLDYVLVEPDATTNGFEVSGGEVTKVDGTHYSATLTNRLATSAPSVPAEPVRPSAPSKPADPSVVPAPSDRGKAEQKPQANTTENKPHPASGLAATGDAVAPIVVAAATLAVLAVAVLLLRIRRAESEYAML